MKNTGPEFYLRIQPKKLISAFNNGEYNTRKISISNQTNSTNYDVVTKFGNSCYDERYIITGRGNVSSIIITTNQTQFTQNFNDIPENANGYHKPDNNTKKYCDNCRRKFTYDHVGIPIKMEVRDDKIYFFCSEIFHSFGCAYAKLIRDPSMRTVNSINPRYASSEVLLKYMFELIHPGEKLVPAKDLHLLNKNNGPLTIKEYDDDFQYQKTPNVICTTIKMEYEQVNNK